MSEAGASISTTAAPGCSHFSGQDKPTWELYSTCIHCGLCLNHCPTYRVLGTEMDSPRGRIYQVLQVDSGRLAIGESFVTHIDRCLDCRACETACPSGVQYGHIVERARAQIETHHKRPWASRMTRRLFYKGVLKNTLILQRVAGVLRFYQKSGLQWMVRKARVLKLFGMADMERLSPQIDDEFFFQEIGKVYPARGAKRGRVAFHAGCIANVAFSELNRASVRVLQENGVEVVISAEQGCCGALHAHAGFRDDARELARRNIEAFLDSGVDAIITNAAGCGSTLKEYDDLLREDPAFAAKAKDFVGKVRDITEYLWEIGLRPPARASGEQVTYQDPCHLAHGQRVRLAPREVMRAVGAKVVEMAHSDYCCGSAGTYNVTQNELSMKILERKMDDVERTSAPTLVTANVGCMLQLRAGVARRGLKMNVKHVVQLLDEAYQGKASD